MLQFSADPKRAEEQMQALIFYLVTFGYIDGDFDLREKTFLKQWICDLVQKRLAHTPLPLRTELIAKQTTHYLEVFEQFDHQIQELFTEVVAEGESVNEFVLAKLKLRCFEIFKRFDEASRQALLATVDELINADGVAHPAEIKFRNELAELFTAEILLEENDLEIISSPVQIAPPQTLPPRQENHPFFERFEEHYSRDPEIRRRQAIADYHLLEQAMQKLAEIRARGQGRLAGRQSLKELAREAPFLDGYVHVLPPAPDKDYELIVFGDLHGCYSCLKAGLLQFDFFQKVQAFRKDPEKNPDVKLVLLGDYIDRGKFSYNGVLRAAINLFLTVPEHVYLLRGNHEYYIEHEGKIYGGVRPAEAINTLAPYMPQKMFEAYMRFFETLPTMLFFERLLFVHGGIPRDELFKERYRDLSSLNDPDIRFQMLWSDPADVDYVPPELQRQNARFPFGRKQFQAFLKRLGANVMIRGHEKINEGFKKVYDEDDFVLLSLFSAGGEDNDDLPLNSSYRAVTPMALDIKFQKGEVSITPFEIDYARYNDPQYNAFFRTPPEIFHRAE